ncbi:MAG: hypothetical protein DRP35_09850, partial [Candidatus Zixiibacteriota bacterium]
MVKNRKILISTLSVIFVISMLIVSTATAVDEAKSKEHYNTGIKAKQEGNIDAAIIAYKGSIGQNPNFVDPYINLGAIYFEQKNYQDALDMFKKASEIDKTNLDAFKNLGAIELKLKHYAEAETALTTALSLKPKDSELLKSLAKVHYYKKNYNGLVETLSKCHTNGGGDQLSYFMLGKGYQKLKKNSDAITALKKSIELKKDNYN